MRAVPRPPFAAVLLVLLAALLLVGIVAIGIGTVSIPPLRVAGLLMEAFHAPWSGHDADPELVILMAIRVPRVLVAGLVGAALAVAGAQMQGLFQNPMASPDVIGTSTGAALGAVLAFVLGLAQVHVAWVPALSCLGAAVVAGRRLRPHHATRPHAGRHAAPRRRRAQRAARLADRLRHLAVLGPLRSGAGSRLLADGRSRRSHLDPRLDGGAAGRARHRRGARPGPRSRPVHAPARTRPRRSASTSSAPSSGCWPWRRCSPAPPSRSAASSASSA